MGEPLDARGEVQLLQESMGCMGLKVAIEVVVAAEQALEQCGMEGRYFHGCLVGGVFERPGHGTGNLQNSLSTSK